MNTKNNYMAPMTEVVELYSEAAFLQASANNPFYIPDFQDGGEI